MILIGVIGLALDTVMQTLERSRAMSWSRG
jgi:hypothetical protein